LQAGGYSGENILKNGPLQYYTNIDQFLAAGDVLMMQNDWPDAYK